MRLKVLTVPAALLLLFCIACNDRAPLAGKNKAVAESDRKEIASGGRKEIADGGSVASSLASTDAVAYKDEAPAPPQQQVQGHGKKTVSQSASPDWDKKIIKTADLNLEVKNFRDFAGRLRQTVQRVGGYMAQEQQTQSPSVIENTVTIRVPVGKFDDLLSQLPSDSDKLVDRKISSEDVTGEVVDTRSRLDTKRAARERYLALLKQAKTMADVLAIQDVIDNIQEEMDAAAGRIAYLGHSAAFSVVNLKFYQVLGDSGKEDANPSLWHKIRESISQGWDGLGSALVGLLSIWPLLLLGGLVWMGVRKQTKRTAAARKVLPVIGGIVLVVQLSACHERIGKSPVVVNDVVLEDVDQDGARAVAPEPPVQTQKFASPRVVRDSEVKTEEKSPVEYNREGYAHIEENRFRTAKQAPLSTFSIDVDAASYSNVRRFIQQGAMPPAGAVRIEEMINYFDYQYPQPAGDEPFAVNTELSSCPWSPEHKLVLIGLQGKTPQTEQLPAANLVFLIDVSGSMDEPDKLPLVKTSLKMLTDQLRENDRVAIVVYAGNAGLVLPSTPGSERRKIREAIDNLEAGGSTAGGAGIALAYSIAEKNFIKGGNNRIVLATDGDFNVGPSSDDELVRMIEQQRQTGVFLSILGFGMGNYQDDKMQQLADKGNGNHYYIDNSNEARKVLVKEFGGTLFTIAKDVKIQVEFNPARVQAYRLIGYENRALANEDFNNDKKDAGELGAGHRVTALYEIIPAGMKDEFTTSVDPLKYQRAPGAGASGEWMTIKLRYKRPDGEISRLLTTVVSGEAIASEETSANFRMASAVAEFGLLLRDSDFKQGASWRQVVSLARGAKGPDEDGYRSEFIRLAETAGTLAAVKR
ncbi:YfbK domain-containing protein [Puia sp. P3]|uniref:YfbK domain-containing protein n=1 Tax=Puia sp. P3 TaxID=3423952 RepID=UPI003D678470